MNKEQRNLIEYLDKIINADNEKSGWQRFMETLLKDYMCMPIEDMITLEVTMNLKLKLKLQEKITEWADENFEDEIWPITYISENTTTLMMKASASVFDAIVDIQEFVEENK